MKLFRTNKYKCGDRMSIKFSFSNTQCVAGKRREKFVNVYGAI